MREPEKKLEVPIAKYISFISGTKVLQAKVKEFKPKIAVFNGKGIYEIFSGNKEFHLGKQPDKVEGTDTVSGKRITSDL